MDTVEVPLNGEGDVEQVYDNVGRARQFTDRGNGATGQPQGSWMRLFRWLALWVLVVWFFGVIGFVFLVVLVRWLAHYRKMFLVQFNDFMGNCTDIWSIIDRLSPSTDQEARETKHEELIKVINKTTEGFVAVESSQYVVDGLMFVLTNPWLALAYLGIVCILTLNLWWSVRYLAGRLFSGFGRWLFNTIRRLRGVQEMAEPLMYEAAMPGSTLQPASLPTCQVSICTPGLFEDTHRGYGVRYGEFLVAPKHVLQDETRGPILTKVTLRTGRGKPQDYDVVPIQSAMNPDLLYMRVPNDTWSKLAVSDPRWSPSLPLGIRANIYGNGKMSTGGLMKTMTPGQITYGGSTERGMSGAAYMAPSSCVVYGIHQGVLSQQNVGFSSVLIHSELGRMVMPFLPPMDVMESSEDLGAPVPKHSSYAAHWDDHDLEEQVAAVYKKNRGDKQAKQEEDIPAWKKMGIRSWNDIMAEDEEFESAVTAMLEKRRKTKKESVEGESASQKDNSLAIMNKLEARLVELSDRLRSLETTRPKKVQVTDYESDTSLEEESRVRVRKVHKCPQCGVVTRSERRLANHMASDHARKQVVMESAIPVDTGSAGKVVKMQPFLVQSSSSRKKIGRPSAASSNLLAQLGNSLLQLVDQCPVNSSPAGPASSSSQTAVVSDGQSSDTKQS